MAKKKFNISSTLKKNKKEVVELAAKVPLKKTTKDPKEIKEKVEEIHADEIVKEEVIEAKSATEESVPVKQTPKAKKVAAPVKGRMVRMTIDTPEEMHLQLKIKSIQARTSMREYVLKLIERDLKKG